MSHLVIDGYNYISRTGAVSLHDGTNLDMARRSFLEKLARYKKQRSIKITVVFDAYKSFSLGRQKENYKGIDVLYSKEGETADDVIIGWVRAHRAGMVVITSDRAIMDEAKEHGVAFITPSRLEGMMNASRDGQEAGNEDEELPADKKGNPRKLPKKLRKAVKRVGKL
jgi:predicted RNA-binding protein with PIN domain